MTRKLIIFNSSWKKWIITRIVRQNLSRNNQLTVSQFSLLLSKAILRYDPKGRDNIERMDRSFQRNLKRILKDPNF